MSFDTTLPPHQATSAPKREEQIYSIQNEPEQILEPQSLSLYIQPKLTVGAPDDPYEKEADAVAEKVMRMPQPTFVKNKTTGVNLQKLQRETEEEEEPLPLKREGSESFL